MDNIEWNVLAQTEAEVISLWQLVHETLAAETTNNSHNLDFAKSALQRTSRTIMEKWQDLQNEASATEAVNLLRVVERLNYALNQEIPETAAA
jgi:hypothetical protein